MSMSKDDKYWHEQYENLPAFQRAAVDLAFKDVSEQIAMYAKPAMDDRAEQLVAAITKYLIESKR